ncbi:hypothetical protein [Methylibium sp.]|uniref:hypothetical protein n=1 Tax=Methylibium sp. TaxID=2067992 RepID=UPI003D129F25
MESPSTMPTGSWNSLGVAIENAKYTAIKLSNICSNPAVSSATKSTTSKSDTLDRWLAATDVFNTVVARGLFGMYQAAYGGISILIDTKRYTGFKVTYADGASEVWVINPGYSTSSVKLFDNPAPNSLTAPNPKASCISNG